MTHHTDAERADFEAWARERYPSIDLTRGGDDYSKALAKDYWSLWQAARRAPAAPVPQWVVDGVYSALAFAEEDSPQLSLGALRKLHERIAAAPQPPQS